MKLITDIDIEKIFKMLMAAGENPFALILKKMEQEQPALVEYLFEADEEDLNDDERDLLVNAGIIAWNIIRETLGEAPVKSDDFIDLRLERNMDLFEKEQETDDGSDEHFDNLFSADNDQPMLMRFLLDIFMERPEGYQGEIRDEMVPILMLHVKTVVDCLVREATEAAEHFDVRQIVVAGGVAANATLRREMIAAAHRAGLTAYFPPMALCTDNAAMVAAAGYYEMARSGPDDLSMEVDSALRLPS